MGYFKELPNISYVSLLPKTGGNNDRILVKNIFKRAKLRSDVDQVLTGFTYYQIKENTRPDILAQQFYGDPELDWVILITNNITNIRDQWPLSNNDLNNYMLEKYGSREGIYQVHHYETPVIKDEYNRTVLKGGMIVDSGYEYKYREPTSTTTTTYTAQPVSNYDYEVDQNEAKRKIKILKPEYVNVFISDMRKMMKYETSSQYINRTTKAAYNPNISGI